MPLSSGDYHARLAARKDTVERALYALLKPQDARHEPLFAAMRYSVENGGKRLRPILLLEFCRLGGGDEAAALQFACALELIHTYSLIHDDLPCMDDDDLRRGKPTNHKVFGEATAVLAGDALLTLAFETALRPGPDACLLAAAARELAACAGPEGMVAGQVLDMRYEQETPDIDALRFMQSLKTGRLIRAACRIGAMAAQAGDTLIKAAETYAECVGLAFQIRDDMLDVCGDTQEFGKPVGSDAAQEKTTYASLLGLEACARLIDELTLRAVQAIAPFTGADFLIMLAEELKARTK